MLFRSVTFSPGKARDSTDVDDIVLTSALTKRLDGAWTVGNNNGGVDTGSDGTANAFYYLWIIKRSDTGVVDALFSTSATSPTMPTNYDRKQRVGWTRTDGSSNFLDWDQSATDIHEIRYETVIMDVSVTGQGTTGVTRTMTAPPNSIGWFRVVVFNTTFTMLNIRPLTEVEAVPAQRDRKSVV